MVELLAKIISVMMPTSAIRKKCRRIIVREIWTYCAKMKAKRFGIGSYATALCNLNKYTEIGNGSVLGGLHVFGRGRVIIGDYVSMGPGIIIQTQSHDYEGELLPYGVGYKIKNVEIGNCVWIGMNVMFLPGARVGEGAIIQAGSVVHGEIPPCSIAGGNPAKVFAYWDKEHYETLKSKGAYFMREGA